MTLLGGKQNINFVFQLMYFEYFYCQNQQQVLDTNSPLDFSICFLHKVTTLSSTCVFHVWDMNLKERNRHSLWIISGGIFYHACIRCKIVICLYTETGEMTQQWPIPYKNNFGQANDQNHLPPSCWFIFWKSIFKQQLCCRFDIMHSMS